MVNIGIKTRPWLHIHHFLTGSALLLFSKLKCEISSQNHHFTCHVDCGLWHMTCRHCFDLWICGSEYLWLVLVGECNSWHLPQPPFYLPTIACSQLAATCGRPLNISSLCIFFRMGIGNGQAKPRPTANEGQMVFILRTQLLGIGNRRKSQ